jgi:hypothetical protein
LQVCRYAGMQVCGVQVTVNAFAVRRRSSAVCRLPSAVGRPLSAVRRPPLTYRVFCSYIKPDWMKLWI